MTMHDYLLSIAGTIGAFVGALLTIGALASVERFLAYRRRKRRFERGVESWGVEDIMDEVNWKA